VLHPGFRNGKKHKESRRRRENYRQCRACNETICKENVIEKERLAEKQKLVETIKRDLNKTAQSQQQREVVLNKTADNNRANDKRLQQGFARLKATVQREVFILAYFHRKY